MAGVFRDPEPEAIDHPELRALYEYWAARRTGTRLPGRRDVDPLDFPALLPHLMLIDVAAPADLRYRLIGTALVRRMGRDATGQPVEGGRVGRNWEKILTDYRYVAEAGRPCLRRKDGLGADRVPYACERLLLPLAADGNRVDMILAAAFWRDDA